MDQRNLTIHINSLLEFGPGGALLRITLNQAAPHVREIALALTKMISVTKVEIKVGVT
jgi:hypothetical protein